MIGPGAILRTDTGGRGKGMETPQKALATGKRAEAVAMVGCNAEPRLANALADRTGQAVANAEHADPQILEVSSCETARKGSSARRQPAANEN